MAGGLDKGLSSSMWSPAVTGRSPYSFRKSASTALRTSTAANSSPAASARFSSGPSTPSSRTIDSVSTPATRTTAATTPSPTSHGADGANGHHDQADLLTAALDRIPTPWAELGRFTKIARRLKWKLPFLANGYNAATVHVDDHDEGAQAQRDEAELMFKLDFFEYYMLLERALVHLMGVFGIRITGGFGTGAKNSNEGGVGGGEGGGGGGGVAGGGSGGELLLKRSDHRFHANVLEALDDVRNPLHQSLGRDDVRYSLARAKELRNRWKNADDPDAALSNSASTKPLTDYDLDRILQNIFAGFEAGFQVAQQFVDEVRTLAAARRAGVGMAGNDMDMDPPEEEEVEWGFMTEAMDWESV